MTETRKRWRPRPTWQPRPREETEELAIAHRKWAMGDRRAFEPK